MDSDKKVLQPDRFKDRKLELYTGLFLSNVIGMILELVASRVMAPYFGNSNFVWTAVIGTILLSGSFGNIIGGKLSEEENQYVKMFTILVFASVVISSIATVGVQILEYVKAAVAADQRILVVMVSFLLFLVPATALGVVTPLLMNRLMINTSLYGEESGRIHAIAAIGSLVGTFAGGFWLIPAFGTNAILQMLAIGTLMIAICFIIPTKKWAMLAVALVAAVVIGFNSFSAASADRAAQDDNFRVSIDTEYGRVIVEDGTWYGEPVRYYRQSGAFSSATFLDEDKKYDAVFEYAQKYDIIFKYKNVKNALMIGGAAYQYPKHYIASHPNCAMDVVEIDPMAEKIARKYFFLDDLYTEFNLNNTKRLQCITADARVYINETDKKYDVILNDVFSGEIPVGTMATKEAVQEIHDHLTDNALFLSNVIGSVYGERNAFLRSLVATEKEVFKYVYIVPCTEEGKDGSGFGNYIVMASDAELDVPDAIPFEPDEQDFIFTDDYFPVENLPDRN